MNLATSSVNIRLLFISDTHLGFDLPFRPRIKRRRRGPDFFKNFQLALEAVNKEKIDAVIHGGDLLYRSKVPPRLLQMAFEPLIRVAEKGIPVYLVPGNHERSNIPYRILTTHPQVHIFNRPRTFVFEKNGQRLALAGFPYVRHNIRQNFSEILHQTEWQKAQNINSHILCFHQCVEGASLLVGPNIYTFRNKSDVIKPKDIPNKFLAVLSGHIHRFQILTRDLSGNYLPAPIFYPGSTERTSFVEKDEEKGYIILNFRFSCFPTTNSRADGSLQTWKFYPIPARSMREVQLLVSGSNSKEIKEKIKRSLGRLPKDTIVKLKVKGEISEEAKHLFSVNNLRSLIPLEMNLSVRIVK
jgi:DNA repair exonuclease SbcCD nuclease subunit